MAGPWEKYTTPAAPPDAAPSGPWDAFRGAPSREEQISTGKDIFQSAGAGLRRGGEFLLGLPGDVNEMTKSGIGYIARKLFGDQVATEAGEFVPAGLKAKGFTTPDVQAGTEKLLGPTYEPKTRPGRYTRSIMEQVPGSFIGPGRLPAKALQVLGGGVGAEAAGEMAEGTGYEPWARAGGGMAGALGGSFLGNYIGAAQTGRDAAREANIAVLDREGVPMTSGQRTGSAQKKYIESELGGSAFEAAIDRQRSVFTDRAMRRLGEAGGAALPEDLARARARIGGEFDRLSAATDLPFDPQLQTRLLDVASTYSESAPAVAPAVENIVNRMGELAANNGGRLTGQNYQEVTTRLRELGDAADAPTQQALTGLRGVLDDAVEAGLTGPALAEWQAARRQYANLMTVERAMTGAGVEAASGQIAPTRLRSAISGGGQGPAAVAEGRSNMTDLANAGVGVIKDMPQSGTAPRSAARAIPAAAAGVATGWLTGEPVAAVGGALAGYALPEIAGRAVMSPLGQSALMGPSENQRMLLAALLASRQGGMGQ